MFMQGVLWEKKKTPTKTRTYYRFFKASDFWLLIPKKSYSQRFFSTSFFKEGSELLLLVANILCFKTVVSSQGMSRSWGPRSNRFRRNTVHTLKLQTWIELQNSKWFVARGRAAKLACLCFITDLTNSIMENISYVKAVEILDSRTQEIASNLLSLKIPYTLYWACLLGKRWINSHLVKIDRTGRMQ